MAKEEARQLELTKLREAKVREFLHDMLVVHADTLEFPLALRTNLCGFNVSAKDLEPIVNAALDAYKDGTHQLYISHVIKPDHYMYTDDYPLDDPPCETLMINVTPLL